MGAGPVRAALSLGRIRPLMRRWLDDLAELANKEAGRADVVVFTQKALGGASIAERLGTPGLPAQLIPTGPPTSDFQVPFAPAGTPRSLRRASWSLVGASEAPWRRMVAQWRSTRLGVTTRPIPFSRIVASRGILSAWSPRLLAAPPEWRPSQRPLGFWRLREAGDSSGGRRALPGRRAATRGRRLRKHEARRPGAVHPRGGGRPAPCGAQGDPPGRMGGVERVGG